MLLEYWTHLSWWVLNEVSCAWRPHRSMPSHAPAAFATADAPGLNASGLWPLTSDPTLLGCQHSAVNGFLSLPGTPSNGYYSVSGRSDNAEAAFSSSADSAPPKKEGYCSYSTILFLFSNNCPIVNQLGSKRSSRRVQPNCVISFWFRQHLVLHACITKLMWRRIFFLHSVKFWK